MKNVSGRPSGQTWIEVLCKLCELKLSEYPEKRIFKRVKYLIIQLGVIFCSLVGPNPSEFRAKSNWKEQSE